jgi:hypothetical protein
MIREGTPPSRQIHRFQAFLSELEAWKVRLDELGIVNGGVVDAAYGSGLSFRDPDNIALEFFAPPS